MSTGPKLRPIAFRWNGKLDDYVTTLAWSPDGARLAAGAVSGQVAIYHAGEGKIIHLLDAHAEGCDALGWRPDGQALATAGRDGKWKLWNAAAGKLLVEHEAGALWAEQLAWSAKPVGDRGHLLAVSAGSQVTLWNEHGEAVGGPMKFTRNVADFAWILNSTTLAVAMSTGVSLREPLTGDQEREFVSRDPILSIAFSPSGKWLMTGNQDCSVHVWNTDNGAEMHMRGFAAKVRQLAWHRGSRWLATGGGEAVSVWDCSGRGPEGRTPLVLEWHPDLITALHYQVGGDWLASGARDGSVAVWSPTQRQNLISGAKISSGVTKVAWSPDGESLAVSGEGGDVQVLAVE